MDTCPHCGSDLPASADTCPNCARDLPGEAAGVPDDVAGREGDTGTESAVSETDADPATSDTTSVSRRGLLVYSGSTMAVLWAGFAATWFALVYEQTGPEEDVVREYVDALDRSKFYTAQQLFHENAPGEAWGPEELPELGRLSLSIEDTEVADRETDVPRTDVQELALVHATITIETSERSNTIEIGIVVAQNGDGEWKLWEDR